MMYNVFWDMDGVLRKYDRNDYVGIRPNYTKKHYFRNRPVDHDANNIFMSMQSNDDINLHILSRGAHRLSKRKRARIIKDKYIDISCNMPEFDIGCAIITDDDKVMAAERYLNRKLTKFDVLIDDFNHNLTAWAAAGGTAIKYINGQNSVDTYAGAKIVNNTLLIPAGISDEERVMYEKFKLDIVQC